MSATAPKDLTRLDGRGAYVTGAGSLALPRAGAVVVATDLDGASAQETADLIADQGGRAQATALDVTGDDALRAAIGAAVRHHGRLDILHSHAGIQIEGRPEDVDAAQMDASRALNVRAHFVAAQAAIAPMRAQGGRHPRHRVEFGRAI